MSKISTFSMRLKEAVLSAGKTQKQLCDEIGISISALAQYLSGRRDPSIATLSDLAKSLNVSSDYLLGLSSVTRPDKKSDTPDYIDNFRDSTHAFFQKLCEHHNDSDDYATKIDPSDIFDIPDKYKSYISNGRDWTYARYLQPIIDEEGFIFDLLAHPKIEEVLNDILYYQTAKSYLRFCYDRVQARKNNFSKEEQDFALCAWDSNIARMKKFEQSSKTAFDLMELFNERENYHAEGIPSVYAEMATLYKIKLKADMCEIIDDCCDHFEEAHAQEFRDEKDAFISFIKTFTPHPTTGETE